MLVRIARSAIRFTFPVPTMSRSATRWARRGDALAAAALRKASAEADVAEVALRKAEAEADAAARKAAAEADAAVHKAAAEAEAAVEDLAARKAASTAAARKAEAEADAASRNASMSLALLLALLVALPLALVLLAIDYYVHEDEDFIKSRMMGKLKKYELPLATLPFDEPAELLPTSTRPLHLDTLPTMILGPTGCGKSTLLRNHAREMAQKRIPIALVRLRLPDSRDIGAREEDACTRMEMTAKQVFEQIGFPARRSILHQLYTSGLFLKFQGAEVGVATTPPSRDRLLEALRLLFVVSEALCCERAKSGLARADALPVLLFDEVQDLVKDARLASAGGRVVFETLAALLVGYGVDRKVVRTAVAGSSALLNAEFAKTVARGNRWIYYELADPPEHAMHAVLRERGYTLEEARAMTDLLGTRVRLLQEPLALGAAQVPASGFLAGQCTLAESRFESTFRAVRGSADKAALVRVLDAATAQLCIGEPQGSSRNLSDLTPSLISADLSLLLFVRLNNSLAFQSQLLERRWPVFRSKYAA